MTARVDCPKCHGSGTMLAAAARRTMPSGAARPCLCTVEIDPPTLDGEMWRDVISIDGQAFLCAIYRDGCPRRWIPWAGTWQPTGKHTAAPILAAYGEAMRMRAEEAESEVDRLRRAVIGLREDLRGYEARR